MYIINLHCTLYIYTLQYTFRNYLLCTLYIYNIYNTFTLYTYIIIHDLHSTIYASTLSTNHLNCTLYIWKWFSLYCIFTIHLHCTLLSTINYAPCKVVFNLDPLLETSKPNQIILISCFFVLPVGVKTT